MALFEFGFGDGMNGTLATSQDSIHATLEEDLVDGSGVESSGNTKHFVTFHHYFDKNWHSCRQMWVFCHRKTFPTMGVNDTQAAESTFREKTSI